MSGDFLNKRHRFSTPSAPSGAASDYHEECAVDCGRMAVLSCSFLLNLACPAAGGCFNTVNAPGHDKVFIIPKCTYGQILVARSAGC